MWRLGNGLKVHDHYIPSGVGYLGAKSSFLLDAPVAEGAIALHQEVCSLLVRRNHDPFPLHRLEPNVQTPAGWRQKESCRCPRGCVIRGSFSCLSCCGCVNLGVFAAWKACARERNNARCVGRAPPQSTTLPQKVARSKVSCRSL